MQILRNGLLVVFVAIAAAACADTGSDEPSLGPMAPPSTVSAALTSEDVVLHAGTATRRAGWEPIADTSAASATRLHNPDNNVAKITTASAAPTAWFEMTFTAAAGRPYHLWLRMKAAGDLYSNDSVHVQFSDSVNVSGAPENQIGTTSSQAVVLEACDGAGRHGWGWSDNGWCGAGPAIRFATSGQHTIRVQQREDGVSIDQIVLSPDTYAIQPPGAPKDDTTRLPAQGGSLTPPPPPPPPPPSGSMKVLTWNTHGPLSSTAIELVAAQNPQVVFLQEVDTVQLVENLRLRLQALQGGTWQKAVISRGTDTSSSFVAIVSKYSLSNVGSLILRRPGTYVIPCYSSTAKFYAGRAAVAATITVNGRTLSVFGVRMTSEGDRGCLRVEENTNLKAWANTNYPTPRIYGGDFNMQPYSNEPEYQVMLNAPYPTTDSWALAVTERTAVAYNGSPSITTPTANTRLDYIFFDRAAPYLDVTGAQIVDHRGLSDHRMMMTTFDVQ
jgi:endonuclease/exonuclease/phosphatase family metal-dependent hydrolase